MFNNNESIDESSGKTAKLVGVSFTEDRFGNADHAIYLSGSGHSYVNLGSDTALKPKAGAISLWVRVDGEVFHGSGTKVNPIILTKCAPRSDYYEAYGMYYVLESKKVQVCCMRDSLDQTSVSSKKSISLLTWYHMVITYDNNSFLFYLNGVRVGRAFKNFESVFDPHDSVVVGVSANKKNNRFLMGAVDDIEFYNRVLTDREVMELYNAPNPNKQTILLNWILTVLAGLVALGLIYLLIRYQLSKTLKKEKQQLELINKQLETELRVNRALMNPHFVFNSLNTLHSLILKNNNDGASAYLMKFSKLMQKNLEGNTSDLISLELEIDLLERYLEIENLRFEKNIHYSISIDPPIVPSAIHIPIMMLQPFVENAIWHGLLKKQGEKSIHISFSRVNDLHLACVIEDNGLGRTNRVIHPHEKKSMATAFILQRLNLLNKIYSLHGSLIIEDKPAGSGTIVKIVLPILKK